MSSVLVLRNDRNEILRNMPWSDGEVAHLVVRIDTRRIEVCSDLEALTHDQVPFEEIATLSRQELKTGPFKLPNGSTLELVTELNSLRMNDPVPEDEKKTLRIAMAAAVIFAAGFLGFVVTRPKMDVIAEQEIIAPKQIVKVMKHIKIQPRMVAEVPQAESTVTKTVVPKTQTSVKRMGALAVLGNMKSSSNKGGLNLGAAQTTAGPGLGGNAGSGGVQSSLYGKGLVSAPLGAGGNVQGGGGYGTKGRGGGKAGYGQMSLVGSNGASPIPLGREAIVEGGGLDRDLIAAVVQRNLGQITFCYEQGLQSDPALAGRVVLDWVVGLDGTVKTASVANTTLQSKIVEDCIVMRLKSWKFPLPSGGESVKVAFPFNLKRRG